MVFRILQISGYAAPFLSQLFSKMWLEEEGAREGINIKVINNHT